MCVRYARGGAAFDYVAPLMSRSSGGVAPEFRPSWNVLPGTRQPVIGPSGTVHRVYWGQPCHGVPRAHRQTGRHMRTIVDTSAGGADSPAWSAVWAHGRVVVPADGWFEWCPAVDGRQPWYIRRADRAPLFMAALIVGTPVGAGHGADDVHDVQRFVLVAADGHAGMVDPHARQPAVLAAPDARAWLDAGTSVARALRLVQANALTADAFDRFPVSRVVNDTASADRPGLIERAATRM
ncbi:SOS response-associated peptidase [Paraburkholderia sp. J67]|uniref:SOS response-associated peptidase n=1 Tax=Paraburkholderia sp. J67 TaxID=2805435 RepID=UPI002ABD629E|nr:SOS response-associated peptidase family protein [Paraburkholderia sp. J67]